MKTMDNLSDVARSLAPAGKGILTTDENTGTFDKRFKSVQAELVC